MKNHPLIKLIINILSNNSTRFFESYIKDFKLNLNNFLVMEDIIKDEVVGSLRFHNGVWGRQMDTPVLNSEGKLILVFQDNKKEGILDVQREAYNTYLQNEEKYKGIVTDYLLEYYKWNYEYIAREVDGVDENDHKDVVTEKQLYQFMTLWYLFICRDGSFGYAFGCCWDVDNGLAVLLSELEPRVISRTQLENLHKLNDPILGLLVHDGEDAWKGLEINSFFGKKENLEIELEGGVDEGITAAQQKAYEKYLANKDVYFKDFSKMMITVYAGDEEKATDMVMSQSKIKVTVGTALPKTLFIDREGNYGWSCYTEWNDSYLGVILSEVKLDFMSVRELKTYKEKDKVIDDVLGLLFASYMGFEKTVVVRLMDEIETFQFSIRSDSKRRINDKMRNAYKTYLELRPTFWNGIKKEMLEYYLDNYDDYKEYLEIPKHLKKGNVNEDSVMTMLTFTKLYADYNGRIGWLCESPLNDDGFSVEFTDGNIDLEIQDVLLI